MSKESKKEEKIIDKCTTCGCVVGLLMGILFYLATNDYMYLVYTTAAGTLVGIGYGLVIAEKRKVAKESKKSVKKTASTKKTTAKKTTKKSK